VQFFGQIKHFEKLFTPQDGFDWRATLGKRASDDFAKMIF